ncbi:hypothetical protein TIFTF001_001817 [Ficus carica]|uniref:Polygalacturonase n=1 Tax=Ficus carica TaxID=3494 RepID=A0AA87Z8T6_FICCA|nr:hypothetical protein TIFTF001_001817 [Ficus carica]
MGPKLNTIEILILLLVASNIANAQFFDVTKNGANAQVDISQALLKTWTQACASKTRSEVYIPKGTYKLSQTNLKGPCNAPIVFNLQGMLLAPPVNSNFKGSDSWISFSNINYLTITGGGTFNGQGKTAWGHTCKNTEYCGSLPINVRLDFITNSVVQYVTSLDSKQFHVNVLGCRNVTFQHFKVSAPGNSINTDGIHIGRSTDIKVLNSVIQTGDDCISIGDGSKQIVVNQLTCGPGHGISIGSLGKYQNEQPVQGVPSKVRLSDISFTNIRGTTSSAIAGKLLCSKAYPCQNVKLANINLKYTGSQGSITSTCKNVKPSISGTQIPKPCLTTAA